MDMKNCSWFQDEAGPLLECLLSFRTVKDKCFGWELMEGWRESIETYTLLFHDLQQYAENVLGQSLTVTWKIHVIVCHLETFLNTVRERFTFLSHIYFFIFFSSFFHWTMIMIILMILYFQFQCGINRYIEQQVKAYMPGWNLLYKDTRESQDIRIMVTGSTRLSVNSWVTTFNFYHVWMFCV